MDFFSLLLLAVQQKPLKKWKKRDEYNTIKSIFSVLEMVIPGVYLQTDKKELKKVVKCEKKEVIVPHKCFVRYIELRTLSALVVQVIRYNIYSVIAFKINYAEPEDISMYFFSIFSFLVYLLATTVCVVEKIKYFQCQIMIHIGFDVRWCAMWSAFDICLTNNWPLFSD